MLVAFFAVMIFFGVQVFIFQLCDNVTCYICYNITYILSRLAMYHTCMIMIRTTQHLLISDVKYRCLTQPVCK